MSRTKPARRRPPSSEPARAVPPRAPEPVAGEAAASRACAALAIGLAVLTLARVALAFVPGMHLWSLNLGRFASPLVAGLAALIALATLAPPLARRALPAVERTGDAIGRGAWSVRLGVAAFAAALVLLLPDRVRFVGDFLLRQGSIDERGEPGVLFPQALPLDVFLHVRLPGALVDGFGWTGNTAARAIGALEAALLALLALAFARATRLRGAAAAAVAALVLCGGWLWLYAGYAKASTELTLVVVALAVAGIAAARDGGGLVLASLAFAAGALLHRSALGFLPALIATWVLASRRDAGAWKRPGALGAAGVAAVALAVVAPRVASTFTGVDVPIHFASPEVALRGGLAASMLGGLRPLDLLNQLLWLAPVLPAALAAGAMLGRRGRMGERVLLATLAIPGLALFLTLHPKHGLHRDWDNAAPIVMAVMLAGAWAVGEALRAARPAWRWVAVPAIAGALAPVLVGFTHHADFERGLARARAFMTGPPTRDASDRGWTWDWIGQRTYNANRLDEAAEAFAHAAETSPSPRLLVQWAMAETQRGNLAEAQTLYRRLTSEQPGDATAWLGLAAVSSRLDDLATSEQALERLIAIEPGNAGARDMLERVRAARAARGLSAPR